METWQVVILRPDGAEHVIGLHLSEEDAEQHRQTLKEAGITAALDPVEMGHCGCRG